MDWLTKLERRLARYAVPNLTGVLVAAQVAAYIFNAFEPRFVERIDLRAQLVMQGEIWRLVTFLAVPPLTNLIFAIFAWYLFFLMGTALENSWGTLRYNFYLLVGVLSAILASFLAPGAAATNGFIQGSVFLAFAYLFPDFQILLFFLLPVKVKWLALLTWAGYLLVLVTGTWINQLLVVASVANFLIFFGRDLVSRGRAGQRQMARQARQLAVRDKPFHRCEVCGITDKTNPDMEFRYCSKCTGQRGYCMEHIRNHEHVQAPT